MSPSEDVKFSNVRGLYLRKYVQVIPRTCCVRFQKRRFIQIFQAINLSLYLFRNISAEDHATLMKQFSQNYNQGQLELLLREKITTMLRIYILLEFIWTEGCSGGSLTLSRLDVKDGVQFKS